MHNKKIKYYKFDFRTKDKLLSAIHKISSLLTRHISLDRILTTIVEETARVFGFTRVTIFLINRDTNLLVCKYYIGFTNQTEEMALRFPFQMDKHDSIETRVAKLGKTIYIKDHQSDPRLTNLDVRITKIHNRVSTIAVPLKIEKNIIGLIEADKYNMKMRLTKKDIDLFSIFGNHASIVIENARLQEQNKKKIKQLMSLQEISRKTSATLNLKKLFNIISTNAMKITRASKCALFLVGDEGRYLKIVSHKGYEGFDIENFCLKIGEGIVGHVAITGIPLLVKDVSEEPKYQVVFENVKSELAVPLISGKQVLGVLGVNSCDRAAFSDDDMKLLMIFAGHTTTLIENARLYDQVMMERNFAENILESSPNGVITINLLKNITSINRKAEEVFDLKRKDVIGKKISDVFEDDMVEILNFDQMNHAVFNSKEIKKSTKDGTSVILDVTTSLLKSHNGMVKGFLVIFRDLTASKKTEELIKRMDRLTSLGQLSAGIAHEIRNPLASINFNVQMLSKKLTADDGMKSIISDTIEGVDRIKSLVKGMLDFAKPIKPQFKKDSIVRVLTDSIALMESQFKKNKIEVDMDLATDTHKIVFDYHKMKQVFVNLLLNAMEAMTGGGTIRIKSRVERDQNKNIDRLSISIKDNGVGIPLAHRNIIFDPFFTTKPEGTGLGLSIVHKILEQHHATIEIIDEEDKGTTFLVGFPLYLDKEGHVSL